jgi:drug/metabolite transporter (DMT)-like permease
MRSKILAAVLGVLGVYIATAGFYEMDQIKEGTLNSIFAAIFILSSAILLASGAIVLAIHDLAKKSKNCESNDSPGRSGTKSVNTGQK